MEILPSKIKWGKLLFFLKKEQQTIIFKSLTRGFPGGAVVKNPPANAGDTGSSPGPG